MVILENSALPKKCGNVLGNVALSLTGSTIPENSIQQLKKVMINHLIMKKIYVLERILILLFFTKNVLITL